METSQTPYVALEVAKTSGRRACPPLATVCAIGALAATLLCAVVVDAEQFADRRPPQALRVAPIAPTIVRATGGVLDGPVRHSAQGSFEIIFQGVRGAGDHVLDRLRGHLRNQ